MNRYISSLLLNILTTLAGIGGLLAGHNIISPDQVATANAAGAQLVTPLMTLSALVATWLAHLLVVWIGKRFPGLAGYLGGVTKGTAPLVLIACMSVMLPACTSPQIASYESVARAIPIKIGGSYNGLTAVYDTRSGITIYYDASGRPVAQVRKPVVPDK